MALPARTRPHFGPGDRDRALLELAVTGSSVEAHRNLAAEGLAVNDRTLREWKYKYAARYEQLRTEHAAKVEERIVEQCRNTAALAASVERAGLTADLEKIEKGDARDPSTSARNASVVKGINVDKMLALSGRPTQIVEKRDPAEIMRKLKQLAPDVFHIEEDDEPPPAGGYKTLVEDTEGAAT